MISTKISKRFIGSCCSTSIAQQLQRRNAIEFGGGAGSTAQRSETVVDTAAVAFRFGKGVVMETGHAAQSLGMSKVLVFADPQIGEFEWFQKTLRSLRAQCRDVILFNDISIEPTSLSFEAAGAACRDAKVDGIVSIGGGSTMDTAKYANLQSVHGGGVLDWTNAPIGAAKPIPHPILPHIAIPSTCGTGAEATGLAIYDNLEMGAKTGIGGRFLKPSLALIDPEAVYTLPSAVVAASGFDVLSHAIESYTARPYHQRPVTQPPYVRPLAQGANEFASFGCLQALRIVGENYVRAVNGDKDALDQMMMAATLAGTAINSAGCAMPHALSYSICSQNENWAPPSGSGWPSKKANLVPHGFSLLTAPACYQFTAPSNPARHLRAARLLDPDNKLNVHDAAPEQAGEAIVSATLELMQTVGLPSGLLELGFSEQNIPKLVEGAWPQRRLLDNAPIDATKEDLANIYRQSMNFF